MNQNPFVSESFTRIWSKHFNHSKNSIYFKFINGVSFVRHSVLPYYTNTGKNLTNGFIYKLLDNEFNDFKGSVFLIRDMPSYLSHEEPNGRNLIIKKTFQYPGFLTNLSDYQDIETYLKTIYKSNTRSKLKRNINRLEACFDVAYNMYFGNISQQDFDFLFTHFHSLLEKRYADKGEACGELNPEIWNYYCELAFELINKKKASLFIIRANDLPVALTFSYHFNDTLIEAITVFDIDFYRFNLGHTMILKMLEWSFKNDIKIFDYTQGDFHYKMRWSDTTYETYYHILYDSNSIKSRVIATLLTTYFNLKRIFRDQKLNKLYHKLKFKIISNKTIELSNNITYTIIEKATLPDLETIQLINLQAPNYNMQRRALYDFLYMNPVPVAKLMVYKTKSSDDLYVKGNNFILKIVKNV